MFSFKGFLTQDKNTHLEHLEDDIINRGANGGVNAVNFSKVSKKYAGWKYRWQNEYDRQMGRGTCYHCWNQSREW